MDIEYEATFWPIDKDEVRGRLDKAGAKLERSEFLQSRMVFDMPKGHEVRGGWLRVRDEGDKVTMSLKIVDGDKIHNQKETCFEVSDFDAAVGLLEAIGCERKALQESKRELWVVDGCEVTIDEWPFLEPFAEVEGRLEESVRAVADKLGFDYSEALFCAVDELYARKYKTSNEVINRKTPKIVFGGENPFV